jgi:transposase
MSLMDKRPDPDELLKNIQSEEKRRGRLKIFLGYVAGVGKTYAMLEAAHQRKQQGGDVVVGYIETHQRAETEELVRELEVLPRKQVEYHNITLPEMDVDAVIQRKPQLVLVDEFAHTNAPGSRHTKRYQDVQEILAAGIDVYTTLNIQHIESLNDIVAQVTGVVVRETIPDPVIDLPQHAEEIRKHLKRISGVDLSVVDGLGVSLAQTVIMEVGTDMSKFPDEKHFCSCLGLAPKHEISGGKVLKNNTLKTRNRAGQAFRMAANSVKQADCVFGVFYRRLRARLGPSQATVATAHAIARVVYRMLKYKVEYEPLNANEYQRQYEAQQIKYIKKRAAKLGFQLVPT